MLTHVPHVRHLAGPGSYDMPAGVGLQVSSSKQTQPMFGFGSAGRDHVAKVFVSEEHNKSLHGLDSPGPQVYKLQGAVGKQSLSSRAEQPAWVFASSDRFKYEHVKRAATSPGPGAYSLNQSVGSQVMSTKTSSPMPGFGTSNRDQMNKLYISTEHEKALSGNNSPGPSNYNMPESTGRQPLSKYSSMPSWGFGTSSRCAYPVSFLSLSARQSYVTDPMLFILMRVHRWTAAQHKGGSHMSTPGPRPSR